MPARGNCEEMAATLIERMQFLSPRMGCAAALVLATTTAPAQSPSRYIVTLVEPAESLRIDRLESIRTAIRSNDALAFQAGMQELRTAAKADWAPVQVVVGANGGSLDHLNWAIGGANVWLTSAGAAAVAAHPSVASVTQDSINASAMWSQTDSTNHNSDAVNALGFEGAGVTVAVFDSGIDIDVGTGVPHPAFDDANGQTRILRAVSFADTTADDGSPESHGTRVAGIAAGRDFTPFFETDGFAPGANIASYRITFSSSDNYWTADWLEAWHAMFEDRFKLRIVAAVASYKGNPSPTHPAQRILDVVSYYGDVLVATSAGNLGLQEISSFSSQSNANGLAVGAISGVDHTMWSQSASGPLPGDPLRYWPDLVAVGLDVFAPVNDNPAGPGFGRSGTSFSAPCVTGTAALMRSAHPTLSALETKAFLLNSAEDISAINPQHDRRNYGLGMLRSDLAFDQCGIGERAGGPVGPAGTEQTVSYPVQAGVRYAATLVWARTDDRDVEWPNLDLSVRRDDGTLAAASDSPRNLYERVVFTPTSTGLYEFEIEVVSNDHDRGEWALVFAPSAETQLQEGAFAPYSFGCQGTGVDPADGIITPTFAATGYANHRTHLPFGSIPIKVQQAMDGATIPSGTRIDALAFRLDETVGFVKGAETTMTIQLGHTAFAPNALSDAFATNPLGGTMTTVFSGTHSLSGVSRFPTDPGEFEFVIPLTTPFVTATSPTQHLLLDIEVQSHSQNSSRYGLFLDADNDLIAHVRVYASDVNAQFPPTGSIDGVALVVSLITEGEGTITPRLDVQGELGIGDTFESVLRFAPPNASGFLVHGQDNTQWTVFPLPFDLGIIGAPGCLVLTNMTGVLGATADAAGEARVPFAIANTPVLAGQMLYQQFLVFDVGANPLGLAVTQGGAIRFGEF